MKAVGIICEYNPFHNGHLYHLKKVKELTNDDVIVLILSGNFLQRGETSIIDKWSKADIALELGIDLVIELPFPFATQSADIFAKGSISLLNHLKVDKLIFGSETNNIKSFVDLANIQLTNKQYEILVKKYLKEGVNYPTSLSKALYDLTKIKIENPNDILGISYVREILKTNSEIEPVSIKRTNNYHSLNTDTNIISASNIRSLLKENKGIKSYVPITTYNKIDKPIFIDNYYPFLKYKILTEIDNLDKYQTVDEGIENRIKKHILNSQSLDELILNVKTKRYTYNKLNRMFTHILCNFTKEEANKFKDIEYVRVLGFSSKGQEYLKKIKKDIKIPIVTNYTNLDNDMLKLEYRVTSIYASILSEKEKIELIKKELNKPILKP